MDLDRIKRNVGRMVEQNAPETDIDEYIASEGTTLDAVRSYRPQTEGAATRFVRNIADTIPLAKEIKAGAATAGQMLTGNAKDGLVDTYYQNLNRERDLGQKARENYGIDNIAAETLGYVSQAPIVVGQGAARTLNTTKDVIIEGIRQGTPWGALAAYSEFDSSKTPTVLGATGEVLTGAAGGAVLGGAITGGTKLAGDAVDAGRQVLRTRQNNRVDAAQQRLQDFQDAGVPVYGPALETDPSWRRTAQSVTDSVAGGRLRRDAAAAETGMDEALARELDAYGGRTSGVDAGMKTQEFLRRNVVERSLPGETLDAMPIDDLRRVADIAPSRDLPPRPTAPPAQPRYPESAQPRPIDPAEVERAYSQKPVPAPVTDADVDAYLIDQRRRSGALVRQPPSPAAMEVPAPLKVEDENAYRSYLAAKVRADQYIEEFSQFRREVEAAVKQRRGEGLNALGDDTKSYRLDETAGRFLKLADVDVKRYNELFDRANTAAQDVVMADNAVREVQAKIAKAQEDAQKAFGARSAAQASDRDAARELLQRRVQAAGGTNNPAEFDAVVQRRKQEIEARLQREAAKLAREEQRAARAAADARASERTIDRQQLLDDLYQRKAETAPAQKPGITLGNVREQSYPTEIDAGYEYARRAAKFENAPEASQSVPIRRSFMERAGNDKDPGRTNTFRVIDEIGKEAHRQGLIRYKSPEESTDALFGYLSKQTGGDVAQSLRKQLELAERDGGLSFDDLAKIRTRLRYSLDAPRIADPNARDIDSAIGERIYQAMTDDLSRFYERAGRLESRDMMQATNRAYRDFKENVEGPLTKIFTDKTDPEKAIRTLVADAQGGDVRRLNAFYRVVRQKGDEQRGVQQATASLLGQMASGGIDDFVKNYRALTPAARNLMFPAKNGQNEMARTLDALVRVHENMAPFRGANARGNDLAKAAGNTINQLVAGSLAFGQIQGALAAYGGAYLVGRYMASPRYVSALTTYMQMSQRNPNRARQKLQTRLLSLVGAEEVGAEVVEALGIEKAEASMRGMQGPRSLVPGGQNEEWNPPATAVDYGAEPQMRVVAPRDVDQGMVKNDQYDRMQMDQYGLSQQPMRQGVSTDDTRRRKIQANVDQMWSDAPTDETAAMIEAIAKQYGVTPPWMRREAAPQGGNPLMNLYDAPKGRPAPKTGGSPLLDMYPR